MKKVFLIIGIIVLVAVIGVAGYVIYLQLHPRTVRESRDQIPVSMSSEQTESESKAPALDQPTPKAVDPSGTFVGLGPHNATGRATLVKTAEGNFIRLEDDFSVTNGPDLHVYVGSEQEEQQLVAVLKGTKGGQNYKLPDNINPESFDTVWIYCKRFATPFAKAKLN